MIRLDAIFLALGIETEDDIFKLTQFFMRMKMPEVGEEGEGGGEAGEGEGEEEAVGEKEEEQQGGRQSRRTPASESLPETTSDFGADEDPLEEEGTTARRDEEGEVILDEENAELVHPNDVLKAMKAFVESHPKFQQKTTSKSELLLFLLLLLLLLNNQGIDVF